MLESKQTSNHVRKLEAQIAKRVEDFNSFKLLQHQHIHQSKGALQILSSRMDRILYRTREGKTSVR